MDFIVVPGAPPKLQLSSGGYTLSRSMPPKRA
jgi:hypothetical protein